MVDHKKVIQEATPNDSPVVSQKNRLALLSKFLLSMFRSAISDSLLAGMGIASGSSSLSENMGTSW